MYGMVGGGGGASGAGSNKSNSRRSTQYRSSANPASACASSGGVSRPSRSLYRRLLTFIKQAWTGVKFGSGEL